MAQVIPHHPGITGQGLCVPLRLATGEIDGEHRVSAVVGRLRITVACREIDEPPLDVDGRSAPDARSGGRELRNPQRVRELLDGRMRDGVALPDRLSCSGLHRHQRAAKGAARIVGTARVFLEGDDGDEQPPRLQHGSAHDGGAWMIVGPDTPHELPGDGVDGVHPSEPIGKEQTRMRCRLNDDAPQHFGGRLESPMCAARAGIEGIDRAIGRADEQPAAGNQRLRDGVRDARKRERPGELQVRHVRRGETRLGGRNQTRVFSINSPPNAHGAIACHKPPLLGLARLRRLAGRGVEFLAGEVL